MDGETDISKLARQRTSNADHELRAPDHHPQPFGEIRAHRRVAARSDRDLNGGESLVTPASSQFDLTEVFCGMTSVASGAEPSAMHVILLMTTSTTGRLPDFGLYR